MSELEVEAVSELATTDAADFVLYSGKGGVGKTTMAAATGVASAEEGTATLVVSTDPAHSLSDVFEQPIPSEPTTLSEELPLWAVEIDPDEALGETALFGEEGDLALGGLGDLLGSDVGDESTMPGADEAAAMQQLLQFLDDERFERVVVDTAPTGHTLRLLELPETLDSLLGQLLQLKERFQGTLGELNPFGDGSQPQQASLDEARERLERLRAALQDPARTDFRLVMVPEQLSVRETKRLRDRLDQFGIPVGTLVVNRVMEPPAAVADIDPETFVTPDLDDCVFCQRRWEVQQGALRDAQDLFRDIDVRRVPLFADEVSGWDMLRVVAACLV
ncbi:MAG: ArsA family ATPase [Halobacteriaceae archaeon]